MLPDEVIPKSLRRSFLHKVTNSLLCLITGAFVFLYFRKYVYYFPITVESMWQIFLADINRRKNKRRVQQLYEADADTEKGSGGGKAAVRCLASVVGYREEANLFKRCMESYQGSAGLEIMLVGIDGNEAMDMEMVQIVKNVRNHPFRQHYENFTYPVILYQVYPNTINVAVKEPFGPLATRIAEEYMMEKIEKDPDCKEFTPSDFSGFDFLCSDLKEEAHRYALRKVYELALDILQQHDLLNLDRLSQSFHTICIHQPHVCKKDIMFTNFVFSLALGHAYDIEYLWTSDSDTIVFPDTLHLTIGCMAADPLVGGSCATLSIHNVEDSTIARLGSAAYWSELAITRGQTGAVDAVDCQPGPCATFKLTALEPILFTWYTQTSLGIKTVVNEDRHLTTKLLLSGWRVTFNTQALAATDTPKTLIRWLLQQLRWARATHIETFQYPEVYAIHGPILFVTAMRRFYGPLAIAVFTIRYVLTGDVVHAYSLQDLTCRIVLCTAYNYLCNRQHARMGLGFLMLSQIFYQLPLPGIIFWSTITALEGSWGTRMRNRKENQKKGNVAWENIGAISAVVWWMGVVAACVARYVVSRVLPGMEVPAMCMAAGCVVVGLYVVLLRQG
ncbi:hypothetical protein MMC25_000822 [Agyrium rufum]|nr:hypothetical protein [Agyrium rufum]